MNAVSNLASVSAGPALRRLLAAVAQAVRADAPRRPAEVAAALAAHAADPDLLERLNCPCHPDRYVRHLLGEGPEHAVAALVWRPGQASPIHAHRAWCALAVHRGVLTEQTYGPGAPPCALGTRRLLPGATSHGPADPDLIHRIANADTEVAVTIHAYGVPFRDFCSRLNTLHS